MALKAPSAFELRVEDRAPLSVMVSRQLRQAIVSGKVAAGTELPSEKELTEELGVGRSTVREALRILQAQGLLSGGDTVSTRRPRVSTRQSLHLAAAQSMENAVRLGQVPLTDLVELRVVIEGAAVAAAAAREDRALEQAHEAIAAMKSDDDIDAFGAADLRFHQSLAAVSGNAAFPLVMGVLRNAMASHLGEALHAEKNAAATMKRLTGEHEAILKAVERGRANRARSLMTDHIRVFYQRRTK